MLGPSQRSAVAPFYVMQLFEAAERRRANGLPVFNLAVGQPGTAAPAPVLRAAELALGCHQLGYTDQLGLPELRAAIARHTSDWYGFECPATNVVVTTGSSGAFLTAFLAAFDRGDVIALPRPGYPAYRNILTSLGCTVHEFACGAEDGYRPRSAMLDRLPSETTGLVLASPANPTGTVLAPAELATTVAKCREQGIRLVSDEIYHGIGYGMKPSSAWQYDRDSIVVNSFSKYFSMTGWRLGWLLVPDDLLDAVSRLAANYSICPPTLSQLAAVAAFDSYAELDANVARYAHNRATLLEVLPAIGLPLIAPADGAFYVYADVSDYTHDSLTWVHALLAATGVALAPGVDFDPVDGGRFVRFSFAGDSVELTGALEVLGDYLNQHRLRQHRL